MRIPGTQLTVTGPYTAKDQVKSSQATRFIGRGSPRSSTHQYMLDWGALANTGTYTRDDKVFVSVEGLRMGRLRFDQTEVLLAIQADALLITDVPRDRDRPYNVGERELADFLLSRGYRELHPGLWGRDR
jgi:hypothetical protein